MVRTTIALVAALAACVISALLLWKMPTRRTIESARPVTSTVSVPPRQARTAPAFVPHAQKSQAKAPATAPPAAKRIDEWLKDRRFSEWVRGKYDGKRPFDHWIAEVQFSVDITTRLGECYGDMDDGIMNLIVWMKPSEDKSVTVAFGGQVEESRSLEKDQLDEIGECLNSAIVGISMPAYSDSLKNQGNGSRMTLRFPLAENSAFKVYGDMQKKAVELGL